MAIGHFELCGESPRAYELDFEFGDLASPEFLEQIKATFELIAGTHGGDLWAACDPPGARADIEVQWQKRDRATNEIRAHSTGR